MLTEQEALDRADKMRKSTSRARRRQAALWAVAMAYATGKQWRHLARTENGNNQIRRLRTVIDPNSLELRVTMDITHRNIVRTTAATKPQRIAATVKPKPASSEALVARHVYTGFLGRQLRDIKALQVWRSLHLPRAVLGTGIVRRHIVSQGKPIVLPKEWSPDSKKPLRIRELQVRWSRLSPFCILRDPAAESPEIDENDVIVGIEQARPISWVKRNFGVDIETETTYGALTRYQEDIRSATGWAWQENFASDSKEPSVIVYEYFFRDPEEEGDWPWQLIGYYDPASDEAEKHIKTLQFGRSPFYGCPIHQIHYDKMVNEAWARGIPLILKSLQDLTSVAATVMARVMVSSYPQWLVEKGTMDEGDDVLTGRMDRAVYYNRLSQGQSKPERVSAPGANPVAGDLLGVARDESGQAVSIAGVQRGEMVKRGQSARAYESVIEQAEVPLNDLLKDDELVLNELLTGTLIDGIRLLQPRPDLAEKMLADQFSPEQLEIAFNADPADMIEAVEVQPESLRHRTPRQIQDDMVRLTESQVIEALDARREMLMQGDVVVDTLMSLSKAKQEIEIQAILAGQPVTVTPFEDHLTSEWVLRMLMSSPRWDSFTPEQQMALEDHLTEHKDWAFKLAMAEQLASSPTQSPPGAAGSPPAPPEGAERGGTVGPQLSIAG